MLIFLYFLWTNDAAIENEILINYNNLDNLLQNNISYFIILVTVIYTIILL